MCRACDFKQNVFNRKERYGLAQVDFTLEAEVEGLYLLNLRLLGIAFQKTLDHRQELIGDRAIQQAVIDRQRQMLRVDRAIVG